MVQHIQPPAFGRRSGERRERGNRASGRGSDRRGGSERGERTRRGGQRSEGGEVRRRGNRRGRE